MSANATAPSNNASANGGSILQYGGAVTTLVSELGGFIAGRQQAAAARQAAKSNWLNTSSGLTDRARQIEMADSQRVLNNAITRLASGGAIAVGAAEGGLSGLSANRLSQAVDQSIGQQEAVADLQDDFARTEIDIQNTIAFNTMQNELAANKGPSGLSLLLAAAGTGIGAAFGGPMGAALGAQLGSAAGNTIDYVR